MNTHIEQNPFQITTPEDLTAAETVRLFVDVFSDFFQVEDPGHVLIKGPRGVGKSMMFRYLEADCQCLARSIRAGCSIGISEIPYIAVYIPLKNASFTSAELDMFNGKHAATFFNEHIMIAHCLVQVFASLRKCAAYETVPTDKLKNYYLTCFCSTLEITPANIAGLDSEGLLGLMFNHVAEVYKSILKYIKKCAINNRIEPYSGALFDYNDYLIPLLEKLSEIVSNASASFYLLLDDAHYLSETQTRILNTWVATRTSRKVSLKISTQYNYKTYYTTNGATIDTPHDYSEVDIATIYTEGNKNAKATYYRRIEDIVKRRLDMFDIGTSVHDFFPPDEEQEKKIKAIEATYKQRFDKGEGKGYNRSDDARRYARPDYIRSLGGTSKSSHTYSYAGFDQLVNISSGIVRYFLQQAHSMYAKQKATSDDIVLKINPSIQNDVVRDNANKALFSDLAEYSKEGHKDAYHKEDIEKLSNLINGLGGLFRKTLISNRSERRVFSIAISDKPSEDVLRILDIGLQLGYFHCSTIGRKESGSIGRTKLYVLNRRLAPIWTLDPNGFAGYLFVKNHILEQAMAEPIQMIKNADIENNADSASVQLSMFEFDKDIELGGSEDV